MMVDKSALLGGRVRVVPDPISGRVQNGLWYPELNLLHGTLFEHRNWPGWQFTISVEVDTGIVWDLRIWPPSDQSPPVGGITKSNVLKNLPLEDLVTASRLLCVQIFETWDPSQSRVIGTTNERGEETPIALATELHPSAGMLEQWQEISRSVRKRAGTRRGRYKEIDDRDIVDALAAHFEWAHKRRAKGETKEAFLNRYGIGSRTLDKYMALGEERGFYVRSGQRGRPGGQLTEKGLAVLRQSEGTKK